MKYIIGARCSVFLMILGSCQSGLKSDNIQDSKHYVHQQQSNFEIGYLRFERVKVAKKKDTISFDIQKKSIVDITLSTPADTGNIRINQIIMPDGTMDGPFDKGYEDTLRIAGTYRLIIAESLMQENPYVGEYRVQIAVNPF